MRRIPWNTSVTFFFLASYKTNFLLKAEGGFPVCVLRSVTNPVCHKHPHTALHLPAGDCSKVLVAIGIHSLTCANLLFPNKH